MRMIFPSRRQRHELRHQVYRHGRAQGSGSDRCPQRPWGKLVMESIVETKASSILQFIHGLRGKLHVTWEEGTWAGWQVAIARKLYDESSDMLVAFSDTDHPIRRGFGRPPFQFRCERTARFFSCLLNPVRRESPELQFPKISQETLAEVVGTTRSREVGDDH